MEKLYDKYENDNNVQVELRESIIMRLDTLINKDILKEVFTKDNLYNDNNQFIILNNINDNVLCYIDKWMRYISNPGIGMKTYPMLLDIENDVRNERMCIWLTDKDKNKISLTHYILVPYSLSIENRAAVFKIL